MRRLVPLFLLLLVLPLTSRADSSLTSYGKPGSITVEVLRQEWKDFKRDRVVPVKIYYPRVTSGTFPVILFSHGLGGSRENYEYIGRHWASHGYVCVHLQHAGSDEHVWKGTKNTLESLRKAVKQPGNALARIQDVSFVLDQLEIMQKQGPTLKGRLDLQKVGRPERRIKAAIAMSPSPQVGKVDHKKAFATVKMPIYHMTGTLDEVPALTTTKPSDRRVPFGQIQAKGQYLVVFDGGDHMIFSGRKRLKKEEGKKDARFHDLIRSSTTAFWDAHLKGDEKAKRWLKESFKKELGSDGVFETK